MRSLLVVLSLSFILTGCGLKDSNTVTPQAMTEEEALDALKEVPLEEGGRNIFGRRSSTSAAEFLEVMEELVSSGQIDVSTLGVRGAVGTTATAGFSLENLAAVFAALQANGGKVGLMDIAKALLNFNGGSTGQTSGVLGFIMNLLQAAAPIISTFFPQIAPIVSALTVIIPIVANLIGGFFNRFKRGSIEMLVPNFSPEFARLTAITVIRA